MKRLAGLLFSTLSIVAAAAILFIVGPDKPADTKTDPLNPFLWADAAESENSEVKFLEAARLAPHQPAILIRVANFYVARDDYRSAIPYLRRVLSLTQAYNGIVFNYYLRAGVPLAALIPPEPKQSAAFLYHLMANRHPESAVVWQAIDKSTKVDPDLARYWVNYQFSNRQYLDANAVWKKYGPFAEPSLLDWLYTPHEHVAVSRNPLTLRFDGTFNSDFRHITRNYILSPGSYRLTIDWESERISTNEGPFVEVAGQALDPLLGTNPRMTNHVDFAISAANPVAPVAIVRRPSLKFDNKIQGTLIIHKMEITPLKPRASAQ